MAHDSPALLLPATRADALQARMSEVAAADGSVGAGSGGSGPTPSFLLRDAGRFCLQLRDLADHILYPLLKVSNLLPVLASIALEAVDGALCSAKLGPGVAQRRLKGTKPPDKIVPLNRQLLQGSVLLFPLAFGEGGSLRAGKRAILQRLNAIPKAPVLIPHRTG
ncbi:hypothetical protein ABIC09_005909 [Bradyrhizobium sp. S3.12.5]|uniref:hypothetical protein n=1 Tax=Bradyrhizobium sp. S3.12.5 TaxID=3156386 RepID=UPI003393F020